MGGPSSKRKLFSEEQVISILRAMKLGAAAQLVEEKIDETLTYYAFPSQLWLKIRTNNPMERLLREARRRTKVVGAFPEGHSALMLVTAHLRHVSASQRGTRKYYEHRTAEGNGSGDPLPVSVSEDRGHCRMKSAKDI
jgi:transposase-like protein